MTLYLKKISFISFLVKLEADGGRYFTRKSAPLVKVNSAYMKHKV